MQFLAGAAPSGYNPFRDDTATTCRAEASYVTNIINAANCSSGGTCNLMLRAQMLATALDVYFSTPTLGGNRIGAYNGLGMNQPPLGNVGINLSQVCSMSDSGGSGTCTGTYEDARPEFGIASTCLGANISTMLSYSNYNSMQNGSPVATPNTGTTWYNQTKNPKQVYAKDSFDSFNNQKAYILPNSPCGSSF